MDTPRPAADPYSRPPAMPKRYSYHRTGSLTRTTGGLVATWLYALFASFNAQAEEFVFTTEQLPPFNMSSGGKIIGIAADKLTEMMKRANLTYHIDMFPWARAYQSAEKNNQTCVFSAARTAERESKFKWVGPVATTSWVLYGLAERNLHLATLQDASSLVIGTYNGDVRDDYLRNKGMKVDPVSTDSANPRKLLLGRIDLWASATHEAKAQINANNWGNKIVPVLTFNRVSLYLACNRGIPDEDIERMNAALRLMESDGTSAAIDKRYDS